MKPIKVLLVFGTRPEAIKMAPLVKELEKETRTIPVVCVTAQHRQMLDQVLHVFDITPHYDFNIMKEGQTLTEITCRVLTGLRAVIEVEKPDLLLVTAIPPLTLLVPFYEHSIGHVEAGYETIIILPIQKRLSHDGKCFCITSFCSDP